MRVCLKNNGYAISEKFPMTVFEMEDVLDKLKQKESVVRFEISEHDNMEFPFALCRRDFSADIYRLNLFAERIENLDSSDMTAFKSLLKAKPESDFEDILKLIDELNYLAQKLSELSKTDFVKLKAVMEAENKHEIYEAFYCIRDLNEYEFDQSVQDYNEFGRAYLSRNLPTNFDNSVLESMDLYDFSVKILAQTGGEVTSYGAISGRGQELYSELTVQPEQQPDEDLEEDIEEDFEPEMGGMTL